MTYRLREAALWMGAVLGLLSVVAGTAVMFFGYSFLIFRSGSMGPEIPTGSLALARTVPAVDLVPGDVVSVLAANGARVTHRLVTSTEGEGAASLILQGDANSTPDEEIYQATEAERSIASLPYLGYVVTVLLSPAGLLGAGCLSAMVLLAGFGSGTDGPTSQVRGRHRADTARDRRALSAGVGVTLVAVAVAGAGVSGTAAFYSDSAQARSSTFSMAIPATSPVTNVRCANVGLLPNNAMILWNAPTGATPTGYRLTYVGNQESGTVSYGPGVTQGRPPTPTQNGNRTYEVTITALYGSSSSAPSATVFITGRDLGLGVVTWNC